MTELYEKAVDALFKSVGVSLSPAELSEVAVDLRRQCTTASINKQAELVGWENLRESAQAFKQSEKGKQNENR